MRPMSVAMVGLRAPWGAEGGVEQSVAELAPRLVGLGCEVTVYCRSRYNPLGSVTHQGVRLVDVDSVYTKHLEAIVHTAASLPAAIANADVVHLHATGPALLSWLPRLAGRGVVVTVHGLDWQREKWGAAASMALRAGAASAARFPHQVIVVGQHLREHYQQTYGRETVCIPNGVGEIGAPDLSAADVPGLTPGGYLLFVGRIVPEKGLRRLIHAYKDSGVTMPLVVVGGATYAEEYAATLRADAPPTVIFPGSRYGVARDALLRNAAAFVYPSHVEGMPLAPLEAMAARRPVFLSDIPPHREILGVAEQPPASGLERAGPGWRVAEGAWVHALRAAAGLDEAARAEAGASAEAVVRAHFGWESVAKRTFEVYQQALASSPRGRRG